MSSSESASRFAHRLAIATAATTVLLIVAGGLVTNTGSGLAVPDWPTTFGYNMFLFPWARMAGGIFFEHSHRLLGALVGVLTLALAASLWPRGGRLRALGLAAIAAVVAQGVLGGLRVVLVKETLAILHGCLAQAFFALLIVIALLTSPRVPPVTDDEVQRPLRGLALGAVALVYLQIVFGALITHAGWVDLHLAGAAVVFALVPMVTARLRRSGHRASRRAARVLVVLLVAQLALGAGAYVGRFTSIVIPGGPAVGLAVPVAHRMVAALILASAVTLAVRVGRAATRRRWDPAAGTVASRATS